MTIISDKVFDQHRTHTHTHTHTQVATSNDFFLFRKLFARGGQSHREHVVCDGRTLYLRPWYAYNNRESTGTYISMTRESTNT